MKTVDSPGVDRVPFARRSLQPYPQMSLNNLKAAFERGAVVGQLWADRVGVSVGYGRLFTAHTSRQTNVGAVAEHDCADLELGAE